LIKNYTVSGRQQSLHAMPQGSSESNSAKQVHALILCHNSIEGTCKAWSRWCAWKKLYSFTVI